MTHQDLDDRPAADDVPSAPMHEDQLRIDAATVRKLVDEQFPTWRDLPLQRVGAYSTVCAVFRIGDRFAARFPLQGQDVAAVRRWLEAEADAARKLLGRTRFPTPEPVAVGEPGAGYPLPWSVQTWITGAVATEEDPGDSVPFAHDLAEFIDGVRAIDTEGRTFAGQGRGGELPAHDEWMHTCFRESEGLLDVPLLRGFWARMRELPRGGTPDRMTHGDLIPGNVLVRDGRLAGVLDVGGAGPADPALDLLSAWQLLEGGPRQVLRQRLGCDDLEWARGRAWAFAQAMGLVWYYRRTNPVMCAVGRRTIARIVADPPA
ncbi:aminoglycoside phosphotransferase family protein [Micromonospora sp. B9E7]|uniref:aminoglycoside phosphotransferase family protein n=1 Tax=Micromonospora sp. B9E7 TaxID=3153574 RepID=UPI00325E0CFE